MKEYISTTGGRYIFNEDIQNLQELALSVTEMFRDSGVNFVLSGCEVVLNENENGVTVTVTSGYAYIGGKIVRVGEFTETVNSVSNIIIRQIYEDGQNIMYADGNVHPQCTNYYGEVLVNFRPHGSVPQGHGFTQIRAISDEDGNWSFPNVRTGFFKANGLLNDDAIIDIEQNSTIDLSTPKLFTIGAHPAQVRSTSNSRQYITNRLTSEEIEDGVVVKLYNNELDDFFAGRFSLCDIYLSSNCTFQWAMAMPNNAVGESVLESFTVHTSSLPDGETASFNLSFDDAENVRAAMGNGEIGLYLLVLSGVVDNQSACKLYPETLFFGKCKNNIPERIYRYCKDLTKGESTYVFLSSSQWNGLSADEKALWQPVIDDGSLNGSKLVDNSVTAEKLAPDALICDIENYMVLWQSVLPMGKIYTYGSYPLEVRSCRTTQDDMPTLVLAWYRGNAASEDSSYPNPYMLFIYVMGEGSDNYIYNGQYAWDDAPDAYKQLYAVSVPDGSVTMDKLSDEVKGTFQRIPIIYDQSDTVVANRMLNYVGFKGPFSIDAVIGELGKYILCIDAPSQNQFNSLVEDFNALVERVDALGG